MRLVRVSPSVHVSALAVGKPKLTPLAKANAKAKTWKIQAFLIETMMLYRIQNVLWNVLELAVLDGAGDYGGPQAPDI